MRNPLTITLGALLLVTPVHPMQRAAVPVYVYTTGSGAEIPPADERGRLASVDDLRQALSRMSKEFVLVSKAEDARVTIEVVDREARETAPGGFGGASVSRFRDTIVRLRVRAGDEKSDLKGMGRGTWSSAATDAVERLSRWVANHLKPPSAPGTAPRPPGGP